MRHRKFGRQATQEDHSQAPDSSRPVLAICSLMAASFPVSRPVPHPSWPPFRQTLLRGPGLTCRSLSRTLSPPMTYLYASVLGAIVLTLLSVSLFRLHTVKTKADYLVAGRSLPTVVLIFTLLCSWIGSGSLLGGAENAYRH